MKLSFDVQELDLILSFLNISNALCYRFIVHYFNFHFFSLRRSKVFVFDFGAYCVCCYCGWGLGYSAGLAPVFLNPPVLGAGAGVYVYYTCATFYALARPVLAAGAVVYYG